jgi:hypothetical protein
MACFLRRIAMERHVACNGSPKDGLGIVKDADHRPIPPGPLALFVVKAMGSCVRRAMRGRSYAARAETR